MNPVAKLQMKGETPYDLRLPLTPPIVHAWRMIARDHEAVFGRPPALTADAAVVIRYAGDEDGCPEWPEAFCFRFDTGGDDPVLHIVGRDELGVVYGMLHFSRWILGVDPFWFWAELPPVRRQVVSVPCVNYDSSKPRVRYRGWFVNDEVCLIGWKEAYPPGEEVWLPVFEALLRCGGNMVIPGTDLPRTGIHHKLAAEMGLWITHHHAEPLGAEMFLRAYPGKQASYQEHPELFERLWEEAIQRQKDEKIVWVLSFRGQGDKPFWENDPRFDTPAKRGELISRVVRKQYDMIARHVEKPICCMAMYGEIAELYKEGHICVPEGVIKVWADNGYGKMVSRRHGNLNLRIPALPAPEDGGANGVYYHVTFHDLQASNHLTMFPSSAELIAEELERAFSAGAGEYLLVNSGNLLQHLRPLDLVSELWMYGKADAGEQLCRFTERMYTSYQADIARLYLEYAERTIPYGPNPDDRAGEEFYHHPTRQIMGHWLRGKKVCNESLIWAAGGGSFSEQVRWFRDKAEQAASGWEELKQRCLRLLQVLPAAEAKRLRHQLLVQIELHRSGCLGLAAICKAYATFDAGNYPLSFVQASEAVWHYRESERALREAEERQWEHFYRADWLTNVANTLDQAETVRKFVRIQGDSPDMFLWYKEFLMPETEKHIYLENTHRNPLPDDELAKRMKDLLAE
ncbi:glycosyl hydrolase 115 family protein [Paenibacillus oralis]|nr:glycosyl hydrolase 115 family protein [Paenibacillus oralis]